MSSKKIKVKSFEERLYETAKKLRGSTEISEYKHVVLSLIFLKSIDETFETRKKELIEAGQEKYIDLVPAYTKENLVYLPEKSRWSYLVKNSKKGDIALKIDTALSLIEEINNSLKGALPYNYFSRLGLINSKLSALIDEVNRIETVSNPHSDVFGRIYEYFLLKFAIDEGKNKGEFYTPKSIVNLIAELIEPYKGKIYDPCCGSGGMFVQSVKFIENHKGDKKDVSIYGQESLNTTYKLARMNLVLRGINGNLGKSAQDTFHNDQHPTLKADFIMANPPFNFDDWRALNELIHDKRWDGYSVPPASNANYAWILHKISKLSEQGIAGFILANGSLSAGGEEYKIRKKLIENDLIEAIITLPRNMFYSTDISVTLWIINKNKTGNNYHLSDKKKNYRNREGEVLFIDLRRLGSEFEKKYIELTDEDIVKIKNIYHNWQQASFKTEYENIPEFCQSVSFEEIEKQDFSLVPSKYIPFIDSDNEINFDEEMLNMKTEFRSILNQELSSQNELLDALKKLGYEIK